MSAFTGPLTVGGSNGYGQLNGTSIMDGRGIIVAVVIGDIPELDAAENAATIVAAVNGSLDKDARIAALERAIDDFKPHAQVAFLWQTSGARDGEVERYRDKYQQLLSVRATP